jgi:kinetochore protein Spc24
VSFPRLMRDGEEHILTINSLKLKLYRTLGIDVEADPTTGQYNKAVIRNAAKGDVHVVNIDPKFSRHFYTNYFWRTM